MQRLVFLAALLILAAGMSNDATAGTFRHNSLFRHYGPRGVYPAHFYDYYAPPTAYGHLGFMAYQGWGIGFKHYPYPYRAYYGGYGYGPYKYAEGHPLFRNYGYAYPPQPGATAPGSQGAIYRTPPAFEDPSAQPNP